MAHLYLKHISGKGLWSQVRAVGASASVAVDWVLPVTRDVADRIAVAVSRPEVVIANCVLTLAVIHAGVARAQPAAHAPAEITLQQAIGRALAASPGVQAAKAGVGAAAGTETQTHAWPNPHLSVTAENIGGNGLYSGTQAAETTYSMSELIELGGKRDARQRAASAYRGVAERRLDAARLDLVRDVTDAYVAAVAAQEQRALAEERNATAKRVLADVTRRVNAARDPLYEKTKAELALTLSGVALSRATDALAAAEAKLGRFWGAGPVTAPLDRTALFDASAPQPLRIYEARLKQSPDIVAYKRLGQARQAEYGLAKAGVVPDVTVSAGVRQFSASDASAFVVGVTLPIPVFNQNQGDIARAGAELAKTRSERRQAELTRSQALIGAWTAWQSAWQESQRLEHEGLAQAERTFKLTLDGYRRGGFRYLDVLDAQRSLYETRAARLAALVRLQMARAQVVRLTASSPSSAE